MDSAFVTEARIEFRYFVVRAISRGGDLVIYFTALFVWGLEYLVHAFVISLLFNYCADFWGQKLWAFREKDKSLRMLTREFVQYIGARLFFASLASVFFLLVRLFFDLHWLTAAAITICIFWPLAYPFYRWVFTGKSVKEFFSSLMNEEKK
jgi:hypothetical protein